MSKAISYSLFGYDRDRAENCFDFNSYLRGLTLCLRFNRLIFPDWQTVLQTDHATYNAFEKLFKPLEDSGVLVIHRNNNGAKLCEAMLWRLKPLFYVDHPDFRYTHVLCRDLDSLATYREAQAVQYWVDSPLGKVAHAITDSVSHHLPMLGGMIGFMPGPFCSSMRIYDFDKLMSLSSIDFSVKGSDQDFLNRHIYPVYGQKNNASITQHYFNGHGNSFLDDWHTCICHPPSGHAHNCPNNYKIDLPEELKETNSVCGHIGAAGYYEPPTMKILYKYRDRFKDIEATERQYPNIFYWNT